MAVTPKDFMGGGGGGCRPLLGAILSLGFLEGGAHFQYFSLTLEKGSVFFMKFCNDVHGINHTKNKLLSFCKAILRYFRARFCLLYSSPCLEKP